MLIPWFLEGRLYRMTFASPVEILQTVFGYSQFRGEQENIINHVLAGGDALIFMPTGSGIRNPKRRC